jgi:hypothetical protein
MQELSLRTTARMRRYIRTLFQLCSVPGVAYRPLQILLVLFSFGGQLVLIHYGKMQCSAWAMTAGVCTGLMLATKETAIFQMASMIAAAAITMIAEWRPQTIRTTMVI